jgi:hypothetical protein
MLVQKQAKPFKKFRREQLSRQIILTSNSSKAWLFKEAADYCASVSGPGSVLMTSEQNQWSNMSVIMWRPQSIIVVMQGKGNSLDGTRQI